MNVSHEGFAAWGADFSDGHTLVSPIHCSEKRKPASGSEPRRAENFNKVQLRTRI